MSGIIGANQGRSSGLVKAAGGGGAWNLLATQTASGEGLIEFDTDEITSTYDAYKFFLTNVHVSNNVVDMFCQFSQSSSYITSSYRYSCARVSSDTSFDAQGSASAAYIRLSRDCMGNNTGEVTNWEVILWDPLGTNNGKVINWSGAYNNDSSNIDYAFGAGVWNGDQAVIDGIKFYPSAGTFDSGTFAIYGLAKS